MSDRGGDVNVVEKRFIVRRLADSGPQRYGLVVNGFKPIIVKGDVLGHVLGLLLGADAARPLRWLTSGRRGEFQARLWINSAQADALQVLMSAYDLMA
ncbi:MAG TPA: hypothetical protein VFV05_06275 [Methylomirabilota bacterium]|nr:hypothetical protein [Methylomirabilota bacterium]